MKKEKHFYSIKWTQTLDPVDLYDIMSIPDESDMAEAKAVIDYIKSLVTK